jgi:nicotinate-nucleotide pyrophosphorylase (carboxylating)
MTLEQSITQLIKLALVEDIGTGDVTSSYFIPKATRSKARIIAKEAGVVSGIDIAARVFREVDSGIGVWIEKTDGASFEPGDVLLRIEGKTRSILTAERTALNFLQRLCGIATTTRRYVEAVKPHDVKLLDTRKTTPGYRLLEKQAVKHGGGTNHRIGLYDQVMVKDNHLMACGKLEDLQAAIDAVRRDRPGMKVQLEAATLEQVADFLSLQGVDMILLDNMNLTELRQAVKINEDRLFLEASGGITLDTINAVAATGVNAISVGALTHSSKAVDLSLDVL